MLASLHRNDGLTQSQLSELTSIARSPIGKIIDQLEQRGYVERRHDPDDRRVNRIHTTEAVEPLVDPARNLAIELEQAVLEGLDGDGNLLNQLVRLKIKLQELTAREMQTA